MHPYEFLTLTPAEARLLVAALNGHLRTPGISARDELCLSIADSCGPAAEGDRLDLQFGVEDWARLVVRLSQLSAPQAEAVLDAVERFWAGGLTLETDEALQEAGIL